MNQVVLAPSGDSPAADGAGEEGVQEVQGEGEAGDEAGREEAARGRRLQGDWSSSHRFSGRDDFMISNTLTLALHVQYFDSHQDGICVQYCNVWMHVF